VLERFRRLKPGDAVLSVITFGELLYGAARNSAPDKAFRELNEMAGLIDVLPLPPDAARVYGSVRAFLEARGEMIGSNDPWIAAHAKAAALIVVTNNVREFGRIPDLES
jgi:tRNA(fMet)-specific endonuclease VapC